MIDIKLVRILKTMNSKELKRFNLFVSSYQFNKNQKHVALLEYFIKHYPAFDAPDFTEKEAFEYLFPKESYKNETVTKLISRLFRLLTEFLAVENRLQADFDIEFNLLQTYSNRGLVADFERLSQKLIRKLNKEKTSKTVEDYYHKFLLTREMNRLASSRLDKGTGDIHFSNKAYALDLYYYYTKLIYACQVINRNIVVKGMEIEDYHKEIISILPSTPYAKEPIIDIWYTAYLMLSSQDKKPYYNDLKHKLYIYSDVPEKLQLRNLFTYLENIAIRFISPKTAMFEALFELYNFQLERDVLLLEEVLIPGIMKNYMTVSLNLNEDKAATAFLENIKDKVVHQHLGSYQFCKALLLFHKKEYDEALDILNEANFQNIFRKLNERILRLKIYYHMDYDEPLHDALNSFRVFLTYNKKILNDFLLDSNRRFANHLSKLLKIKSSIKPDFSLVKDTVNEDQKTVDKKWLLEQLSALM